MAIVHGFGEHGGRYQNIVGRLVPRGFAIYAHDHRGHGRSHGQRGHIDSFGEYREDVGALLRLVRQREGTCPLFLFGHSLGALIALDYLLRNPQGLAGAVISGAPIEPAGVARPAVVAMAKALSRIWPTAPLKLRIDAAKLSRDPAVASAYASDSLVHGQASARFGTESLAAISWVKGRAADIRLPILFLHGEADQLNLACGVRKFVEKISSQDKTLCLYPGSHHEVHNDLSSGQMLDDLERWLKARYCRTTTPPE